MNIGIIGATTNKSKYGYKVLRNLKKRAIGNIYPITPKYQKIEDIRCYKDVTSVPDKLDLLIFIVPPHIGIKILKEGSDKGIKNFWFQPGAESSDIEEFCKKYNLNCSLFKCVMVADDEEVKRFII